MVLRVALEIEHSFFEAFVLLFDGFELILAAFYKY